MRQIMQTDDFLKEYARWLEEAEPLKKELSGMTEEEVSDAFCCDLEFGTGGLRGLIGPGTNRMNVYTVARASQGLSEYLNCGLSSGTPCVAIAYDSRRESAKFARTAAEVFAANGIRVRIFPELVPTPCLSFAVRYFGCSAGVVITASHNPSDYNGYKVYGGDGSQITAAAAGKIQGRILGTDVFRGVRKTGFEDAVSKKIVSYIGKDCMDAFIESVSAQSVLYGDDADRSLSIVYTPLNGAGRKPVLRVLDESGFTGIHIVEEQREPDGLFPTCPYPNPEKDEALELGIRDMQALSADLLIATDPDSDRVGVVVRDGRGNPKRLTGNETGLLLFDFICSQRMAHGTMPEDPVMIKTIVTTDMADKIADRYGVRTVNVLTGFKYIGEQIGLLDRVGKADSFIFGFEESCGYLPGTYVRDKDAVGGSLLVSEMAAFYRKRGQTLTERLEGLYREYGYYRNRLLTFRFDGLGGQDRMRESMAFLRGDFDAAAVLNAVSVTDYLEGIDGLPKSNVLRYVLADGSGVTIRPSGTEPIVKAYLSVRSETESGATRRESELSAEVERLLQR